MNIQIVLIFEELSKKYFKLLIFVIILEKKLTFPFLLFRVLGTTKKRASCIYIVTLKFLKILKEIRFYV